MWPVKRLVYSFARAALLWQARERCYLLTRSADVVPDAFAQDKWKNPLSFATYDSVRDAYACTAGIVVVCRYDRAGVQDLLKTHGIDGYWDVHAISKRMAATHKKGAPALTA